MSRKATTFRFDPAVQEALVTLSKLLRRTQNQLVNDAVRDFVVRRGREAEVELEATLSALRAYRLSDPNFECAISDYVEAEATLTDDPAQGRAATGMGPAQTRVLKLLDA